MKVLILQKMELGQKNFVKSIDLISRIFLAWTFLNFLAHVADPHLKSTEKGCVDFFSHQTLAKALTVV